MAPSPAAGSRSGSTGRKRAVEARQKGSRGGAGVRKAGFGRRSGALLCQRDPEHEIGRADRVREALIAAAGCVFTLPALGLGEQHVEHDGSRARLGQALDQLGKLRPRPGPLAHARERLVVDCDDAHRSVGIVGSGRPALVKVEDDVAQRPCAERLPIGERTAQEDRHDRGRKPDMAHRPAALPLRALEDEPLHGRSLDHYLLGLNRRNASKHPFPGP